MADDLSTLWRNFSLSEEESLELEATVLVMNVFAMRGKSCRRHTTLTNGVYEGFVLGLYVRPAIVVYE